MDTAEFKIGSEIAVKHRTDLTSYLTGKILSFTTICGSVAAQIKWNDNRPDCFMNEFLYLSIIHLLKN